MGRTILFVIVFVCLRIKNDELLFIFLSKNILSAVGLADFMTTDCSSQKYFR